MRVLKGARPTAPEDQRELSRTVAAILEEVRTRGDEALRDYGRRFDGGARTALRVSPEEIAWGRAETDPELLEALEEAAENLRGFARRQREALRELPEEEASPGVFLGHRVVPVDSCCCYVPGGGYPLISTALMLAIPAAVAGVPRVCACSPVMRGTDRVHPAVLAALDLAGVKEIYAVGGAQAVGALAFGTESIPPVSLIVGPGNRYVTEAKRQCYGRVGIDFVAGPSEVLILAEEGADPDLLAADLLAQAEHDPDAAAVVISDSEGLLAAVARELEARVAASPRRAILEASLTRHGRMIRADRDLAIAFSQAWAPEHLELVVADPEAWLPRLTTAGAVFVGSASAEAFGDYGLGPNHVLPTARTARFTGPLGVATYLKRQSLLRLAPADAAAAAPWVARLAEAEGLVHHAASARLRAHHA